MNVRERLIAAAVACGWVLKPMDLELLIDDDFRLIIVARGGVVPC